MNVAVIGLGAMGRGIAQVMSDAGTRVSVLDGTRELTEKGLDRLRAEAADAGGTVEDVHAAMSLDDALDGADMVVEAIVEDLEAKRELLGHIGERAGPDLVVASNTSSLSIAEMARAYPYPSRVLGLHFFNPPTKMQLVEVVRSPHTEDTTLQLAVQFVHDLGKQPVVCVDSPNFIVNRICRPLYYEAQLLVAEGLEPARVDAIARGALGHRVGPIELLDFVGLHTHLASSETALREFGDPRYRPIPITRRLVRAGLTGRDVGRGFYDHDRERPREARARVRREPGSASGVVAVAGPGAPALLRAAPSGLVPLAEAPSDAPVILSCPGSCGPPDIEELSALAHAGRDVVVDSSHGGWLLRLPTGTGWMRLHVPPGRPFIELVDDEIAGIVPTAAGTRIADALDAAMVAVPATPGLVADRLVASLVNEAVAVVEEGLATREDVDTAMRLGMNHPAGPFQVLDHVGAHVILGMLEGLQASTGDPRYRARSLLRRMAASWGRGLTEAG